ncbi:MAG: signal transduction histidine kinase [Cyclobacteriaceae bacterium]|jgi:signal transduction histidine kinase
MVTIVISSILLLVDTLLRLSFGLFTNGISSILEVGIGYRFLLGIILGFVNLWLSSQNKVHYARLLLVFLLPYVYLILPLQLGPVYEFSFIYYPYSGVLFIVFPVILFDFKRDKIPYLLASFSFLGLTLFSFELLQFFDPRERIIMTVILPNIIFYRVAPLAICCFIMLAVNYLLAINDRNADKLDARNDKLSKALSELKITQEQLIKNEKMAIVGRMSSELTHEINTPIAAMKANLGIIKEDHENRLRILKKVGAKIPDEQLELMYDLIEEMIKTLDTPQRRDLNNSVEISEMSGRLNSLGIESYLVQNWAEFLVESQVADEKKYLVLATSKYAVEIIDYLISEMQQVKSYSVSQQAILQAERLIYKLKSYAYSAGKDQLRPFYLLDSLDSSLSLLESQFKFVTFQVKAESLLPQVIGSADEMTQVVNNLLINAVHAMSQEGVVEIGLHATSDNVELSIEDSGGGIHVDDPSEIFDAFFTTKGKGTGTGLGLNICKQIIKNHNGTIRWNNTSKGAIFNVRLPIYLPTN